MNQTRTTEKNKAVRQVLEQVNHVILEKSEEIKEIMTAFLADGHVLLEDIPGVGKTTLAVAFSKAMQLDYRRVQFTPDVLPSDLTGFSIYRREEEKFVYQEGRDYVTLLDVSGQFPYVVSHRILLSGTAKMEKKTKKQIIDEIIKNTEIPPMGEGYR